MQSVGYFTVRTVEQLTRMMLTLLSSSAIPTLLKSLYRKGQFCPNFFPACSSPFLGLRRDVLLPKQQLQHQKDLTLSKSLSFLGWVCCVASGCLQLPGSPSSTQERTVFY